MSTHASAARIAANQANAARSTGPVTEAGKAKSSRNAVTTALTGRTVVLATEDKALYDRHLLAYREELQPATEMELSLVQAIADTDWRLNRIPHLIMALEAKGCDEVGKQGNDDCYPFAELEAFLKYEKQIRNLYLQESRLHRRREKDLTELRAMQKERELRHARDLSDAANLYVAAQQDKQPFHPADHGFVFSIAEIETHLAKLRANSLARQRQLRPADTA